MVGKRNAQFLKHMDVVENNIGLVDADGHNVLVAVRGGTQLLQAGQGTLTELSIIPNLIQIQQHTGLEVRLNFLAGVCLEGLRAFSRLLQYLHLHHHRAAGTAGDGVGLGLDFAVDILKAIHHALDGVLFTAGCPPMVNVHRSLFIGGLQDGRNVHVIGVFLGVLRCGGAQGQGRNCQCRRQRQGT